MLVKATQAGLNAAMTLSERAYKALEQDWRNSEDYTGIYRPGYSKEETEAITIFTAKATYLGGTAYQDLAGNVHIHFKSAHDNKAPLMIGSHIDAVPEGGRYDGTAGIVAGLAAVEALHRGNIPLAQDVILTVFRAEESAWWKAGTFGIGSKLIAGKLKSSFLQEARHKDTDKTLATHMEEIGMNPNALAAALDAGQTIFPYNELGAYIEVHIEQGPSLLDADKSLGIVTDIRGNTRFPKGVKFHGKSAHSGATPQHLRQDAAIAASTFVSQWAEKMQELSASTDLVFSVPDIHVESPSATSVPKECFVQPEVRSTDLATLKEVRRITQKLACEAAEKWNVDFTVNEADIVLGNPSHMDRDLHDELMAKAEALGISVQSMPSGAGHDAGTMADIGVRSSMIFIRHGNEGVSHSPDEILGRTPEEHPFRSRSDFEKAVELLAAHCASGEATKGNIAKPVGALFSGHGIQRFHI